MKNKMSIHIGEYHASKSPTVIHTLVGSCVAVCLFDPVNRIGGMNHILLPGKADMKRFDAPARYGINAMELLINRIMNLGGERHLLLAKTFGGAHLLPSIAKENSVGRRIAAFVLSFLENEAIPIAAYDLKGHESRRIYFHTDTGEVFLKRVRSRYYPNITVEENKMLRYVKEQIRKPAEVDIFFKKEKKKIISRNYIIHGISEMSYTAHEKQESHCNRMF